MYTSIHFKDDMLERLVKYIEEEKTSAAAILIFESIFYFVPTAIPDKDYYMLEKTGMISWIERELKKYIEVFKDTQAVLNAIDKFVIRLCHSLDNGTITIESDFSSY